MLYKKAATDAKHYHYVAVLQVHEDSNDSDTGQRTFRLDLADGTSVSHTFELREYKKWWSSFLEGGQVINP